MAGMTTDTLSENDWIALRQRHVHGDDQIRMLYDMVRGFATSYDDMAFTASTLATITARTLVVHGDRRYVVSGRDGARVVSRNSEIRAVGDPVRRPRVGLGRARIRVRV